MSILVTKQEQKQGIEPYFYQFYQDIIKTAPNVDPDLVIKLLLMEAKLREEHPSRAKPHVNLYVTYKQGIDLHQKQERARDDYPIQVSKSRWNDGVVMVGLMSMKNVELIASDPDIVMIKGRVSPAFY